MSKLHIVLKAKHLSDLVSGLGVCQQDVVVTRICDDTRQLQAGDTFLCLPRVQNRADLIAQAITKGASALIVVGECEQVLEIPLVHLPDMSAVGTMLRRWFETESSVLPCIGITGTDGKTSTAWMLRETLEHHLGSAWSCGTLGWVKSLDAIEDLGNTTPSLMALHTLYALANQEKIGALVLEVSSHGIAQERIAGLPFSAVIWTTMGQDHLEDHGGFDAYLACKAGFVKAIAASGGVVIANADYRLIQDVLSDVSGQIYWYGQQQPVDLAWAQGNTQATLQNTQTSIHLKHMPLADFHIENLSAVALLMQTSFAMPLTEFTALDGQISTPMGRLEPVNDKQNVFIDYAHTAEGLKRCLQSAQRLTQEQLLLVFGCGGDRDKEKRPQMGAVAVAYADECWLTSDNPRSEKQADIADDVLQGVGEMKNKLHICHDRSIAIRQAVSALKCGGILVVAGKGHEAYMEIQGERLPWSDKAEVLAAMQSNEVQSCI